MPIPGCKTAGDGVLYRKFYPKKGIIMRILLCSCLFLFTLAASAADGKFVRYADFGAKGDGKTNDAAAIIKAHKYANEHGLPGSRSAPTTRRLISSARRKSSRRLAG